MSHTVNQQNPNTNKGERNGKNEYTKKRKNYRIQ